jgi:hypothetical protein
MPDFYTRRTGNSVPGIMDYAAPYINLAIAIEDRKTEKEEKKKAEEQLKIENEWRNRQLGIQESTNQIALDTNKRNEGIYQNTLKQQELENASKPAGQRPLSKDLIKTLDDEMTKMDVDTGLNIFGAFEPVRKVLRDSAGTKPASESYFDMKSAIDANKDDIISSLEALKPKTKDPAMIQKIDKVIADTKNGGDMMLSKLFPSIHTMAKSEQVKAQQASLDKLAEKDVEENKSRREAVLKNLNAEYAELSKALTPWYTGEKDQVTGQPLMNNEQRNRIFRRMKEIEGQISNINGQTVGGAPVSKVPQPQERPGIGGQGEDSLIPASGSAIDNVPVIASGPRMTQGAMQPPSVEDDATYIAGLVSTATKKGADGKNLPAIKALIDDFTARHPDKESQTRFMQAIELAESGISEEDILPVMVNMRMSRPQAIEYLKNKVTDKKNKKKEGTEISGNLKRNLTEIGGNIKKGVRGILDEE